MRETIEAIHVLGFWRWLFLRLFYRAVMRVAHRWHWHYATPIYLDGDTQLWCKWCGLRQTVRRSSETHAS